MNIDIIKKQAGAFLANNGATILTAGGVIGTITTAVLAGRASFKASTLITQAEANYALESDGVGRLDSKDKLKIVLPHYVPTALVGTLTVGCIVGANLVSARKAAALAAAYALTDERFKEYREKVSTKLTGPKQQAVIDELAQDQVTANPPDTQVIILSGDVLFLDRASGRYFSSTVERVKRAELEAKEEIYNHNSVSLSEFYAKIGLKPTAFSNDVGWNLENPIELSLSTTMAEGDRPCIAIDFGVLPKPEFHRAF